MNLKELKDLEYLKCVALLSKLIDLDDDTEKRILKCFQNMGVNNFFQHLESIDLPFEIFENLESIKSIIEEIDEERRQI